MNDGKRDRYHGVIRFVSAAETYFILSQVHASDAGERKYYLPEVPGRNLTPSPSATAIIWALAVFAKVAIAFFSNGIGKSESSEGIGGSTIS